MISNLLLSNLLFIFGEIIDQIIKEILIIQKLYIFFKTVLLHSLLCIDVVATGGLNK